MFLGRKWGRFPQQIRTHGGSLRVDKQSDRMAKKRKYITCEVKRRADKAFFSDTEFLLSVGQVGAKHLQLACASLLNYRLLHENKCYIPTKLFISYTQILSVSILILNICVFLGVIVFHDSLHHITCQSASLST